MLQAIWLPSNAAQGTRPVDFVHEMKIAVRSMHADAIKDSRAKMIPIHHARSMPSDYKSYLVNKIVRNQPVVIDLLYQKVYIFARGLYCHPFIQAHRALDAILRVRAKKAPAGQELRGLSERFDYRLGFGYVMCNCGSIAKLEPADRFSINCHAAILRHLFDRRRAPTAHEKTHAGFDVGSVV